MLRIGIIIPIHNEQKYLSQTLDSLLTQTRKAEQIILVDDNSTDNTHMIIERYKEINPEIKSLYRSSSSDRIPGGKIVQAFNEGLKYLSDIDIICKFDADLIFPSNYLQQMEKAYMQNPNLGMFAGVCSIEKKGIWVEEKLTNKDHIRGPIKSYRKACFEQIGGLKIAMGWDTADELLARYYQWQVQVDASLWVKHLRPTAQQYSSKALYLQGEMFYRLGYGLILTVLASVKLAHKKRKYHLIFEYLKGYFIAKKQKKSLLLDSQQVYWVRKYRWANIKNKIFFYLKKSN